MGKERIKYWRAKYIRGEDRIALEIKIKFEPSFLCKRNYTKSRTGKPKSILGRKGGFRRLSRKRVLKCVLVLWERK